MRGTVKEREVGLPMKRVAVVGGGQMVVYSWGGGNDGGGRTLSLPSPEKATYCCRAVISDRRCPSTLFGVVVSVHRRKSGTHRLFGGYNPLYSDPVIAKIAGEAKVAGPVQYRWMYPFERYMRKLKSYVRNKARPEGSIAECHIAEECLVFCSRYLGRAETRFNRKERNFDGSEVHVGLFVFSKFGRPMGKKSIKELSFQDWNKAQLYILKNCKEVQPFIEEYENINQDRNVDLLEWFEYRITELMNKGDERASKYLLYLAQAPIRRG
ncbi:hypothetical protein Nepgr_018930 [Nepenthes gracilis]|uniref:DUF4218 domain-containing protein n=1 Tax=Nepenthes gracilis TaxID=150966 RepID=A0AAD3SUU6_NEPGR|nr:hypothetical protein Nepgr_018930 [Nepenthes gracilis]